MWLSQCRDGISLCALGALIGCANPSDSAVERSRASLLYGDDQRKDIYAVPDESVARHALGGSVALVPVASLRRESDGGTSIAAPSAGETYNLCSSERFREQPAAAECSGTLIGGSLVLTAGHCARRLDCADQAWVFGYAVTTPGSPIRLLDQDIYRCKALLVVADVEESGGERWDYAAIELDRPVASPKRSVVLARAPPEVGEPVTVVGYPLGTPMKIDSGASVLANRSITLDYFMLNSDTFDRSSGSGVFDARGRMVGIVARGAQDFEYRNDESCMTSRRVPDDVKPAEAEQASYAATPVARLCESGWQDDALCSQVIGWPIGSAGGCAVAGSPYPGSACGVTSALVCLLMVVRSRRIHRT